MAINVSCAITYPPSEYYSSLFNPWQLIQAQAIDDGNETINRTMTCTRYDDSVSLANITHGYTNGSTVNFNFTLNSTDSGSQYAYNCSCTADDATNTTNTVYTTVAGIGTDVGALAVDEEDYYFIGVVLIGVGLLVFGIKLIYISLEAYTHD